MSARRLIGRGVGRVGSTISSLARRIAPSSEREQRVADWFAARGDQTLRIDYPLDSSSIVFDLGGYQGQWTSDIYSRYGSKIFVFEPLPVYADYIQQRFAKNSDISVHAYGLGARDERILLAECRDESTVFVESNNTVNGILRRAADFFHEHDIARIDLMKINIEGGEYDLLEHLLDTGLIERITDVQVQFHDFVPDAEARMAAIQSRLEATHQLTFEYRFVWENWRRRWAGVLRRRRASLRVQRTEAVATCT